MALQTVSPQGYQITEHPENVNPFWAMEGGGTISVIEVSCTASQGTGVKTYA